MSRRLLTSLAGPVLIIVGLAAACANAYVVGMADGRPVPALPADVERLRSVRLTSLSGVVGGSVLVLIGLAVGQRRDKGSPGP